MADFVAYNSRLRIALLTLTSLGFVATGFWMIGAFGDPPHTTLHSPMSVKLIGWFSIVFFGLCTVGWASRFLDDRAQVEIGPQGVRSARWSDHVIPWSEIADITTWTYKRQKSIILRLKHPERYPGRRLPGRLSSANKALTGGDVSISLTGTNRSHDDAMAAITLFKNSK